jgi:hypothetical protein
MLLRINLLVTAAVNSTAVVLRVLAPMVRIDVKVRLRD